MHLRHIRNLIAFSCLSLFPAAAHAEYLYAIDSRAVLATFDTERPGAVLSLVVVRGLAPGETVLGLDFRPANKRLYALGSSSRIYVIDPPTGQASAIGEGSFSPALEGTKFGFSFNPTVDRIRITSNSGQNLRVHPDTGVVAATDGALNYADGSTPGVVASAYTNSVAGATATTLYNFDLGKKAIVTQAPPNDGTLSVAFALPEGADFSEVTGFDIVPNSMRAFLATRENGAARTQLYEVDLGAKTATLAGTAGVLDQISAITIAPEGSLTPLYDRLGGIDAISAVVDQFLANVVGDNRINGFFAATVADAERVKALRQNLIDLVCVGSGGPCEYKGQDMRNAHRGMKINDAHFDALVEDLVKALDQFNVPVTEKAALLGVLAPMRGDIVEAKQMQMLGIKAPKKSK
jgi:truncated hemoglobin YjbI